MPDKKYTDDPAVTVLTGAEKWPMSQTGVDKYCTPSTMLGFISSNMPASTLSDILLNGNTTGASFIILSAETPGMVTFIDGSKQLKATDVPVSILEFIKKLRSDAQVQLDSQSWKGVCDFASTGNINLTAVTTVDGGTLSDGNLVLVKDQTAPVENGKYIYDAATSSLKRTFDFDVTTTNIAECRIAVSKGTDNAGTLWKCTNANSDVIGTNDITFVAETGGTIYTGTAGQITISGNVIGIDGSYLPNFPLGLIPVGNTTGFTSDSLFNYDMAMQTLNVPIINVNTFSSSSLAGSIITISDYSYFSSNSVRSAMIINCGGSSDYGQIQALSSSIYALGTGPSNTGAVGSQSLTWSPDEVEALLPFKFKNQISTSGTPSIVAGLGAGVSPTISIVGTNQCGTITLTTGIGTMPNEIICTGTFSNSFAAPNGGVCNPISGDSQTAFENLTAPFYGICTTTTFIIMGNSSVALNASTTYTIPYTNFHY